MVAFHPSVVHTGVMLKSESERIAFVRTVAPLVWAFLTLRVADWGVNLDQVIADALGLSDQLPLVNSAMTVILGVLIWLLARFAPQWLERILMVIAIKDYAYTRDNDLVTPDGVRTNQAQLITSSTEVGDWVQAFLASNPDEVPRRLAAAALLEDLG